MDRIEVDYAELTRACGFTETAADLAGQVHFDVSGDASRAMPNSGVIGDVEERLDSVARAARDLTTILADFSSALAFALDNYRAADRASAVEFARLEDLVDD